MGLFYMYVYLIYISAHMVNMKHWRPTNGIWPEKIRKCIVDSYYKEIQNGDSYSHYCVDIVHENSWRTGKYQYWTQAWCIRGCTVADNRWVGGIKTQTEDYGTDNTRIPRQTCKIGITEPRSWTDPEGLYREKRFEIPGGKRTIGINWEGTSANQWEIESLEYRAHEH